MNEAEVTVPVFMTGQQWPAFLCIHYSLQKEICMQGIQRSLDAIQRELVRNHQTVGVVESVTSGNLQAALSRAKNATDIFQGGLTVYNAGQKARHLLIDPILAQQENCVAGWIAGHMAAEACRLFSSSWGIGITGYAAPVPEWNVKNTLFAWFAFAHQGDVVFTQQIKLKKAAMQTVQQEYVKAVLRKFAVHLKHAESKSAQ